MNIFLLLLFWSLWFVNFSTRTVLSPLLPVIETELALSHAQAGSIFSFLSAGYTITLLLSGLLSPRIGYKRTIVLGFLLLSAAVLCFTYAHTYLSVAMISFLVGLGAGIYLPSAIPFITAVFGRDSWGKAIAFHETAASSSILAIPLLTALGLRFLHWRSLFIILSTACVIVLISFWAFTPSPRSEEEQKVPLLQIVRRSDFWIIAILWIFASSNSLGLYNVIPLLLVKEKGMGLEVSNTMFGLSRVGGVFIVVFAGFLIDRYGVRTLLSLVLFITGMATMGLALAQRFSSLVIMLFIQATIGTVFFPVGLVAISKLTTVHERSTFTGTTIAVGVIVGLGVTPAILGAVADALSFQVGMFVLGLLTVMSSGFRRYLRKI
jgi:NNP family nitrate/nitrite transporter-like MFS transporter